MSEDRQTRTKESGVADTDQVTSTVRTSTTDTDRSAPRRPAPSRSGDVRPHRVPFAVLLAAILVGGLLALLGLNTASAAGEVAQRKYDAANASLSDIQQQLTRDLAAHQSPAELAKEAARLGLIPAANPAFLRFNPDGSVTILGSPGPVTIPAPQPKKKTSSTTHAQTTDPKKTDKSDAKKTGTSGRSSASGGTSSSGKQTSGTTKTTPSGGTTQTLPGGPR